METVFSKTLDRLVEKGWTQGEAGGPDGPNCLVGAAAHSGGLSSWRPFLDAFEARGIGAVSTWNDDPARTFEDVALVLKELHEEALDAAG